MHQNIFITTESQYKKQNNVLEEFRLKAHMRSFVRDPFEIDKHLLEDAVAKLKKLPFQHKDPTSTVAIDLLVESYRRGYYKYEDLTIEGCKLVKLCKYRRQSMFSNNMQVNLFLRHQH